MMHYRVAPWRLYMSGLMLAGSAFLAFSAREMRLDIWVDLSLFFLWGLLANLVPVAVPGLGLLDLAYAADVAAITALGAAPAAWSRALARAIAGLVQERARTGTFAVNLAFEALAYASVIGLAGYAFRLAGGLSAVGGAVLAIVFGIASILVPALVEALRYGLFFPALLARRFRDNWAPMAVSILIGLVVGGFYPSFRVGITGALVFTAFLVLAVYATRLYAGMKDMYWDTFRALIAAIEAKDLYTRGHSQRVAAYALAVGRKFLLTVEELSTLYRAALLHDIGKIGIGDEVLNKAGLLTGEEYGLVKEHAALGGVITQEIAFSRGVAPLIRHHHERYDGQGYPDGVSGEDIPLGSRILAVADAYDAMTSERSYRPAMTPEQAVAELEHGAGQQFDPTVVRFFRRCLAEEARWGKDVYYYGHALDYGSLVARW